MREAVTRELDGILEDDTQICSLASKYSLHTSDLLPLTYKTQVLEESVDHL